MISLRFFGRFLVALLFGLILALYCAQYNTQFKYQLQQTIQEVLHKQLGCHVSWRMKDVGLFFPELVFEDLVMSEHLAESESKWSWKARQLVVRFSWLQVLMQRTFDIHVTLRDVAGFSTIHNGTLPLLEHIKKFFLSDSSIPITIKEITVEKSNLVLRNPDSGLQCTTAFFGSMASLPRCFKLIFYSTNGRMLWRDSPLVEHAEATTSIEIPYALGTSSTVRLDGSADLMPLSETTRTSHFSGIYQYGRGNFQLSTTDDSFCIRSLQTRHTDEGIITDIDACLSLKHVTTHVPSYISSLEGNAFLKAHCEHKPDGVSVDADMKITNARYGTHMLGTCSLSCSRNDALWHGSGHVYDDDQERYTASWDFDEKTHSGCINCSNCSTVGLPFTRYWTISPHEGTVECIFNGTHDDIHGSYRIRATNKKIESSVDSYARFEMKGGKLSVDGALGTHSYQGIADFFSPSLLQSFVLNDESGTSLIAVDADKDKPKQLHGHISYPLIKHLSLHLFDTQLGGQGILRFIVDRTNNGFAGRLSMTDSTIRLLQTHNFIRDFKANIDADYTNGSIRLHDFMIQLQKGQLYSKCCAFYFDDYWHLTFAHAPLFAHKIFLNMQKDMFVILSGSLLGSYSSSHGPSVSGSLVLDRSQLKKNIFSSTAQKNLLAHAGTLAPFPGSECALDITLASKMPLHVKTSVLDAHITCDCALGGTIGNPSPTGIVQMVNGSLSFPYRPLPIVSGKLYFSAPNTRDPALELVARGKVKKYHITMRVDGTVSHPTITFESSPPLTEEQIITLLLSGSDDGSLALAMPALVMHNVQSLLFGDEPTSTSHDSFIKQVLKPLKIIRIVPNFSDQQARGGIRGSLIIDLDSRFHALIQKNFSLPEDTRFEVEYHVSDDMTVRAIKDEHSDLGGEVEMRWKF